MRLHGAVACDRGADNVGLTRFVEDRVRHGAHAGTDEIDDERAGVRSEGWVDRTDSGSGGERRGGTHPDDESCHGNRGYPIADSSVHRCLLRPRRRCNYVTARGSVRRDVRLKPLRPATNIDGAPVWGHRPSW